MSLLLLLLPPLSYYFATKHSATDIKFPGVVELITQLLILENILWLPLCRINKFGLNTLPSKTVAIPYILVGYHSQINISEGIFVDHLSNAYELFTYCSLLSYFGVATVTITTKLLLLLLPLLPLLPYYFATKYFAADTKLSRCG